MIIIKHGHGNEFKFTCQTCGCEYLAARDEVTYCVRDSFMLAKEIKGYECSCPECGSENFVEEKE